MVGCAGAWAVLLPGVADLSWREGSCACPTSIRSSLRGRSPCEAGTLQYELRPIDLGETLAEVASTYSPHLDAKGARIETELPPDIIADVDKAALGGVLINLLENAIKYAREEEPDLLLRIELRSVGGNAIIDVLDRGRGVPDDQRVMIFDSFYRASNSGEVRGAGLGLSLVRHFVEAHGGSARMLPRTGGGSIVRLSLPLHSPTQKSRPRIRLSETS